MVTVDSDLSESISALKQAFDKSGQRATLGVSTSEVLGALEEKLRLPRRYREFLRACDPVEVEVVTPTERVCLLPSGALEKEQLGFALTEAAQRRSAPSDAGWRPEWVIIGHSGLLGDPYFLDVSKADAEGDCPVYTAMSGTDLWQPKLCASTFAMFIRILAINLEVAQGFDIDDYDVDDESLFREAVGPRIREYDPAAVKAGHWT